MEHQYIQQLTDLLTQQGASVVGFADVTELPEEPRQGLPFAISIGVALQSAIVRQILEGPTRDYEAEYKRVNQVLHDLTERGMMFLREHHFRAETSAVTLMAVSEKNLEVPLPHKTVATRAGLGWIGKCALLVTKEFGSAIRLGSILTDAELPAAEPINESLCGECSACVDMCPAAAPSGNFWQKGMVREDFYDAVACYRQTRQWKHQRQLHHHICGICIAACPWTIRSLQKREA